MLDASACFLTVVPSGQESNVAVRDTTILLAYNSYHDVVNFTLPDVCDGPRWLCIIDTNQPNQPPAAFPTGHVFKITGRSLVGFALSTQHHSVGQLRQMMGLISDVSMPDN